MTSFSDIQEKVKEQANRITSVSGALKSYYEHREQGKNIPIQYGGKKKNITNNNR